MQRWRQLSWLQRTWHSCNSHLDPLASDALFALRLVLFNSTNGWHFCGALCRDPQSSPLCPALCIMCTPQTPEL